MTCGPELAEFKLPAEEPLFRKMAETGKEVTVYDIEEDPVFDDCREACRQTFERMQAQLLVPLIYEKRLTGLISLCRKKSGTFYPREDINLLNVLASQGAVAVENARMVQDVFEGPCAATLRRDPSGGGRDARDGCLEAPPHLEHAARPQP